VRQPRELPPLRAVLQDLSGLGLLVVDGYADLDPAGQPGLGAHAHAEFGILVIGVAKSRSRTATHALPAGPARILSPPAYLHRAVAASGSAMAVSATTLRVQEFDKGRGPVGLPPIG
jgi:deoxyribonuclease V